MALPGTPVEIPPNAPRVFIHVDMDAFFAAIEQRDHPEWRGKPVVVGAPPDQRGVVSTASYEARAYGVHSAMPSSEAGRLCPHAVFVAPDMVKYEQVSAQVFGIFGLLLQNVIIWQMLPFIIMIHSFVKKHSICAEVKH